MADDLGPWAPLTVRQTIVLFDPASFRWWIGGGHALELFVGRSWRRHADMDVGVCRADAPALAGLLGGWDLHVAAGGRLTPWDGEALDASGQQNNVWCRRTPASAWSLDVTVGEGDERWWVYRRDPSLRLTWDDAVLRSADGVPYLAPDLQLLFKSTNVRPKDDEDARQVVPTLPAERRQRLRAWLPVDHPWSSLLSE
jgi:hypothetical protein